MREIIVLKLSILLGLVLLKVLPSGCGFSPVGRSLKVRAVRELMKGFTLISPSSVRVLDVSQYAVEEIARTRKSGHLIRLGGVVQATYQVVNGYNFNLTLTVQETDCPSPSNVEENKCTTTKEEECWVFAHMPYGEPPIEVDAYACAPDGVIHWVNPH